MLAKSEQMIRESAEYLRELAIGGTAVGTGINAHPRFGDMVAEEISRELNKRFTSAKTSFTP